MTKMLIDDENMGIRLKMIIMVMIMITLMIMMKTLMMTMMMKIQRMMMLETCKPRPAAPSPLVSS